MTRIVWKCENCQITGEVGSLRYVIHAPSLTPSWRVWVHLNENGSSVGGTIVTMKAPDLEAAKYAAECHLRKFVAKLIGPTENAALLERALIAEAALDNLRRYDEPVARSGSGEPGTLLRFGNGKWFFLADAAKPTPPDTTGA